MAIRLRRYKENLFYIVIFSILFIAPVISEYVQAMSDPMRAFDWHEILDVWKIFGVYLLIFLIHNFLIAPILIYKHKTAAYALAVTALLTVFVIAECSTKPGRPTPPDMEIAADGKDGHHRPPMPPHHGRDHQPDGLQAPPQGKHHSPDKHHPPLIMGQADVIGAIILFFMFGMNLAVKFYFKNEKYRKQMSLLEKQNLEHQLEYLKYQINPHFFMNTLNNIHALVDIDPEKAKTSIVVLSKMMRYILYESNNETIPLQRELAFINNYIALMRMRYTDKVSINIDMPQFISTGDVPPLMLITFVENAFKHGISYQQDSFIDIHVMTTDDQIIFLCKNSKRVNGEGLRVNGERLRVNGERLKVNGERLRVNGEGASASSQPQEGGVGLANVRKRLDLLYHDNYQLTISEPENTYEVDLRIPLTLGNA